MSTIPWRRVRRGLAQFARQHAIDPSRVGEVCAILQRLVGICGIESRSRQALYRIGCALLAQWPAHLYVPVCPDYSHNGSVYTYQGLGCGLPLLYSKHRPFLDQVLEILPQAEVTVLLADHEAGLEDFRVRLGVSQEKFTSCLLGTKAAIQAHVPPKWMVRTFNELFPDFLERAWERGEQMLADPQTHSNLRHDSDKRSRFYDTLGYPHKGRLERTAHVAGQYVLLGEYVRDRNALVCNHSTTSLRWYRFVGASCLHNPVSIY